MKHKKSKTKELCIGGNFPVICISQKSSPPENILIYVQLETIT
jgi:hypothetical protein